jgi:hypothetical protein
MFLKVSDEKCLTTKGLTKIEYNKTDKTIVFSYENERKEQVFLDCPLYRGSSLEYAEFAREVYAHCYLAIIMAELDNKCNISTSFDYILADDDLLLDKDDFDRKYGETKGEFDGLDDKNEILKVMVADLVDDLMDDFADSYLED